MKGQLVAIAGLSLSFLMPSVHASDLSGLSVKVEWLFPDSSTVIGSQDVTVGPGVEISCPGAGSFCAAWAAEIVQYDFGSNSISFVAPNSTGHAFATFNGFRFSGLGAGGPWSSVSLITDITGLTDSNIEFDGSTLLLNVQGLHVPTQGGYTLTLNASPVPLPASIVLLGTALGGLGYMRKRLS